jgi:hypothetical protein
MPDGGNGSVHQALGSFINLLCGERDKGGTAPPLSIPAAPRGNRCCALHSPPACLTAAGSTRHPVSVRLCPPSMASRPCHSRFGSPISAGTQPLAFILQTKAKPVSLELRFCRPDKRTRHPALSLRHRLPDGGFALSGLRGFSGCGFVGRISASAIRQSARNLPRFLLHLMHTNIALVAVRLQARQIH